MSEHDSSGKGWSSRLIGRSEVFRSVPEGYLFMLEIFASATDLRVSIKREFPFEDMRPEAIEELLAFLRSELLAMTKERKRTLS